MLTRRHRETPDWDPAFKPTPQETLGPVFRGPGVIDSDIKNDARLTPAETAAALKGEALTEALEAVSLSTSGTADEKRARYAEWLAEQESLSPELASVDKEPTESV